MNEGDRSTGKGVEQQQEEAGGAGEWGRDRHLGTDN